MQLTTHEADQTAETLRDWSNLHTIDWLPGARLHVLSQDGHDVLLIEDAATGRSIAVYGDAWDRESGGSVHDHARAG